ncbi:hypothetical protein XH99_22085 [Bradyrhizobium nanningense]|uniref:Uncharacterized protein n=1 Tax=Bradyrhizobium nanningense TaxID=1325118 RepID=A0A4Q0S1C6_9BRAD|nr:hypothetical protein [Bradyrhizobium nanningense]RXH26256.1 hypothetical protein XH99_22085 [Bradyrhizobium nanningense]RXH29993.1 hypothetical protein XH84_20090 [Bradyrhizobium nanningense]
MLAGDSALVRYVAVSLIALAGSVYSGPALAYRPFDGTDAAVAAPGELEVELQPAGVQREQGTHTLIAPWTVLNIGLSEGWEAVFEGRGETPLSPSGPTELIDAGAFLKHVVVPGSLQEKTGPSVATEFGVLLPDSTGNSGAGLSWAGIVSQRWDWGTVHFNVETLLTREHRADVFVGTIIEGPTKWKVRPVAEVFYEKEFGLEETVSGLVGLIWQVSDKLSFDVAYRHAVINAHPLNEIRAGLTFAVPLRFEGAHNR